VQKFKPKTQTKTGKTAEFHCKFHPCTVGEFNQKFRLFTLHNSFEDITIGLKGEGYVQAVCWELYPEEGSGDMAGDILRDLGIWVLRCWDFCVIKVENCSRSAIVRILQGWREHI